MIPIFKSLDQISTGYTVFEQDQVLTHEQLNSVSGYADDQIRLTRVKLLGVGLADGLRVALDRATGEVKLTKGVGVTTDGDLLFLDDTATFTQFRVYDRSYPAYPPFYRNQDPNDAMMDAWELLTDDVVDDEAAPISLFESTIGSDLSDMVAVLLMESYLKDEDICSGSDCDNIGIEALNKVKLVMISRADAAAFIERDIETPGGKYATLQPIVAHRPLFPKTITTSALIAGQFRGACNNIHPIVRDTLKAIWAIYPTILTDVFSGNPTGTWETRLNNLNATYQGTGTNIQYYYDFLKDLTETYNDFHELLFGDRTVTCPSAGSFPKHLLVGELEGSTDLEAYRTRWYPSPVTSRSADDLEHAKFLLKKIDLMIGFFSIANPATADLKITPSMWEDHSLEERAIPYYYPANSVNEIHRYWNFRLTERGAETRNYSYHAASYGATGGAATPFVRQLGRFSFYRIEGHLGKQVVVQGGTGVLAQIKAQIRDNNLPFAVIAVHAGTDRQAIAVKPAIRYNDLHRLHYVLRQDVVKQLDDVKSFSTTFRTKVYAEPSTQITNPEDCDCQSIRTLADTTSADVTTHAVAAQGKLNLGYTSYLADTSWQTSLKNTMVTAGQFKSNLGAVVKTDFVSPYDTLIASTHTTWLPWLDDVIKKKDEAEDDKLLLTNFLDRNPAAEHFAGVVRGGTFVLVYDTAGVVVADFMLPYYWYEIDEPAPAEPALTRPDIRASYVVDNGIKVQPSRNTLFNTKVTASLATFSSAVDTKFALRDAKIDSNLQLQNQYVGLFGQSIQMLGTNSGVKAQARIATASERQADATESCGSVLDITDDYLIALTDELRSVNEKIAALKALFNATQDDNLRAKYQKMITVAQVELGNLVCDIMEYFVDNGMSIVEGSDAATVVQAITRYLTLITDADAKGEFFQRMRSIIDNSTDDSIVGVGNNMIWIVEGA